MWVICFKPNGTDKLVPQILCSTEQEARNWVQNAPFSVVGSYIYMFVPTANPIGYFQRKEVYTDYKPKKWQCQVGDFPNALPSIMYTGGLYDQY